MRRGIVRSYVMAGAFLSVPTYARADVDVARQHFEAGKRLRDDGDCARAISEFDKSLAAGASIGAFYNLGYCHEQLAQRQEAYDAYKHAQQLARAKEDERLREISGALASLLEKPHVRLLLPQPLPAGLQITVDDHVVPAGFYAIETVVFTNASKVHVVSVTAPAWEELRENVATNELKAIVLRRAGETPSEPSARERPEQDRGWTTLHWLGLGLSAGGLVGGGAVALLVMDHVANSDEIEATYGRTRNACPKTASGLPETTCETAARNKANGETTSENTRITVTGGIVGSVALGLLVSGGIIFFNALGSSRSAEKSNVRLHVVPTFGQANQGVSLVGTF